MQRFCGKDCSRFCPKKNKSGRISKSAARNAKALPSVCKGQYGFSGQKHRKAVLSSLPGASPSASSAWLPGRFCSRKTPQDLPASKNQGWQGRRTKVGLSPTEDENAASAYFGCWQAYRPLHTEGTERAEQRNVLESICQRECYQQGYRDCITLLKMLGILA